MNAYPSESLRHRLTRYAIVALIVGVVGGIFVQREFFAEQTSPVVEIVALQINQPAPDFTLQTDEGTFRLSEQRGKVVVVNFWASWCAPCRYEMPEFQEIYEELHPGGEFELVGVNLTSSDTRSAAERFLEAVGVSFTIAWDTTGEVTQQYGVRGLPATFFIDRDGIVRSRTYGPVLGDRLLDSIAAADNPGAGG